MPRLGGPVRCGTTALPKGVMWRQDDMFGSLNATALNRYPEDNDVRCVPAGLPAELPAHVPPAN